MRVHVYRNRSDDRRPRGSLHFCTACGGWYGVPHDDNHCQDGRASTFRQHQCACRPCREASGLAIQGSHGFFTEAERWQP